ncbi:MAG: bifunctional adenosylcobinamide kinase/adenosylcobinamide-phosphate guanylyltransferase [Deltaproteobacteria bacterium]|nr:bifunctional adenosylcobinamide kinase/adenosylcobinamide-phosphate guanylyltransferase [Deltaproteobacteria bacterium]
MSQITFVIGGCRSGKSRFALEYAQREYDSNLIFVATCVPRDDEMKDRIFRHQKARDSCWVTVEAPIRLSEAILRHHQTANLILVDCITLWLNNLLFESNDFSAIDEHVAALKHALSIAKCPVILVSNEVGTGIVPENRLARQFRDLAGTVHQTLAACSHRVVWMVAGIPVFIKGKADGPIV